ncbi:hypothetical protein [Spirosoma utsteinense]|uniref:Outer membrane protein beta-barrel domain-containing protein n=1 Tax=Spirosoma utsteinense TaxID=2585773 RepID=A0ABR6W523_9BACT|nr:hypothetical protein [Spirosoma utsteinense]MBC3785333.1 hypothetical protein [Spirosoma utsteinense]MBC3791640.1 hypothetical protein [Spirosoma utsteinense]
MKNRIIGIGLLIAGAATTGQAQDTTKRSVTGFRFGTESGLLTNNSLTAIQQKLQQTNIDAKAVGDKFSNVTFSFVRDWPKHTAETRFLFMGTTSNGPAVSPAIRRARLSGFGVGFSGTYKLINTRRFIVGPMFGYDMMWYRLALLPVDRDNLLLATIANNPAAYNPVTFRQGLYLNLHAAAAGEYRLYWLKRYYDELRVGARVGYQLPSFGQGQWRFNDGTIGDLPRFQPKMLYYQVGVSFFPKKRPRT